jgi:cobalt-zinc-cadmium efflux system outer membrane protein
VELARGIAVNAEKRLRAGEGTRLELNSATIEQGKSEVALSRAEFDQLQARVALAELLTLSPRAPVNVVGRLSAPSLSLLETNELVDRSIERRQDLAAAADDVIAARESLQLTRRQLVPNPSLSGGYATEGKEDVATIGVTFSLPLSIRANRASVSAAQARLSIAEADQDELRLVVEREVVLAVAAYAAASNQLQLIGKGTLATAAENVQLAQAALQAGKIGSPVVAESMATFLETRNAYLTVLDAVSQAATDLELATGGIVAIDSGAEPK